MVISHKYRFVFVEVPHTGSHSISEQLLKHYDGEMILRKHANVTQFLAQANASEKGYFKFATVRNPLDAAATDYAKLLTNHRNQYTEERFRIENGGHITPEHRAQFRAVHDEQVGFAEFFKRYRAKVYNNWFLVGHQYLDHVIRFEDLSNGYEAVLAKVGAPLVEPLQRKNPTKTKTEFTDYYPPEMSKLVASCYGPFMQKWGYEFPPSWPATRIPLASKIQFHLMDQLARLGTMVIPLDPDHPVIAGVKRTADKLTSKSA